MKRFLLKPGCVVLALCSAFIFAACGDNSSKTESSAPSTSASEAPATVAPATEASATEKSSSAQSKEIAIDKLHTPAESGGDLFTGYWKITEGTGAQLKDFVYCFDGTGKANLLIGTMGYCGSYEIHVVDNKDVFTTKLTFGLNGDYTYEFSKDRNTVVLTNISDSSTSTIEKLEAFSSVPEPPENPVIDEALLGAWMDDTGEYLYFDKNGIMYTTQKNITFSYYTYSAKDGKITATYVMKEPQEETSTYEIKDGKLIYNNYEYGRISADELV